MNTHMAPVLHVLAGEITGAERRGMEEMEKNGGVMREATAKYVHLI